MRRRNLPHVHRLAPLFCGVLLCAAGAEAAEPSLSKLTPPIYEAAPGRPGRLLVRHSNGALFFSERGLTLSFASGERVGWGIAGLERAPVPDRPQAAVVHELVGPASGHRRGLKSWSAVRYPNAFNGAELLVESKPGGYAWSLHAPSPAALEDLVLRYSGVEKLSIDVERSRLVAQLGEAQVRESGLACRQPREDGTAREVRCVYGQAVRTGERQWDYTVRVFDADPSLPLIVDPDVRWAGRLGGSGDELGSAVGWDEDDRVVIAVVNVGSGDFPVSGAKALDFAVIRIREAGDAAESYTFVGGSKFDKARAMLVGAERRIYVVGETLSGDLPARTGAWIEELQSSGIAAGHGFACALAPDASSVVRCTYLGGDGSEELAGIVYSGVRDALYVVGTTSARSFHGSATPLKRNVFAVSLTHALDDSPQQLVFGGDGDDVATSAVADEGGYVYIGGSTDSQLAGNLLPGLQQAPLGGADGFVLRFKVLQGTLSDWTLLGGSGEDAVRALALGEQGTLFVLGDTGSSAGGGNLLDQWPVKGTDVDVTVVERDLFLSRLSGDLTGIDWSMLLGGSEDEQAAALVLHPAKQHLYLAASRLGITSGVPLSDLPGLNYFDDHDEGPSEAILASVKADGTFLWSSYLGGAGGEVAGALAVRSDHLLYLVGATGMNGFPVTPGAINEGSGVTDDDVFFAAIPGDLSPPTVGTVFDGPASGEDLDQQADRAQLSAHWTGFDDPESGIVRYRAGLGTTPTAADVVPFADVPGTSHTFSGLTLEPGTKYHVLVRATNGSGDTVGAASNGITIVDLPDAGSGADGGTDPGSDAGSVPDAGVAPIADGGTGDEPGEVTPGPVLGWRCAAGGAAGAMPGLFAMAAAALLARRRRR